MEPRIPGLQHPNQAQADVVNALGRGPVKVMAAAGSGKTGTMAALYARAVLQGTAPSRIMAVTFTTKAAADLRQKIVAALLDASSAEAETASQLPGAWIGTFHQLLRRLLREQAYLAGVGRDLALCEELEAAALRAEALDRLRRSPRVEAGWIALLPEGASPRLLDSLLRGSDRALRQLRSTGIEPEECERLSLTAYQGFLGEGDAPAELALHRLALRLTLELWSEYEALLEARGLVDFDGLLRQGLRALRSSPELRHWCQENFQLVIVDEYQDTSAVQAETVLQLTGPAQRSLFVVGDARQSIYAFRDADPAGMAEAPGRPLELFVNHRSRRHILSAADRVIRADPHFARDLAMEPYRGGESPLPVYLAEAKDPEAEARALAATLGSLHREGIRFPDGSAKRLDWSEMAVLARTFNRLGRPLEEALRERRIPFQNATGGLLDRPQVKDVLSLLRLASDEEDDLACLRMLQSAVGRVPDRALGPLFHRGGQRRIPLETRLRRHLEAGASSWDPQWRERASHLLGVVEELRRESGRRPGDELLALALRRSGLLRLEQARLAGGDPGGRRALEALEELERLSRAGSGWVSLQQLLQRLQLMAEGPGVPEPPDQSGEDLLTLSTIHSAKGLEWPVVILADCRPHRNRGTGPVIWDRDSEAVITTQGENGDSAAFKRWKESEQGRVEEEEHRRLVYVAMTRARDLLLITTSRPGIKGEFQELSSAAAERSEWVSAWPDFGPRGDLPWSPAPETELSPSGPGEPGGGPAASPSQLLQRWRQLSGLESETSPGMEPPDQLSFSSLERLGRCPRQFWFSHLARFPGLEEEADPEAGGDDGEVSSEGREQARALGDAVHQALQGVHLRRPQTAPTGAELEAALGPLAERLSPEQLARAREMLRGYGLSPAAALPTVATELSFRWSGWAGPRAPDLVGKIDRLARLESGELIVLDYKTNAQSPPQELESQFRQLRLYAAALERGAAGVPPGPPRAALVELGAHSQLREVSCTTEELEQTLSWARAGAQRIQAGDYRATQGFPHRPCRSCPFLGRCPERRPEIAPSRGA